MHRPNLFFLLLSFFVFFLWHISVTSAQVLFKANDFNISKKELFLANDCVVKDKRLRLTPAKPQQSGACWYQKKVNIETGFETEFTFLLSENDEKEKGGDGFAFVIHNQPLATPRATGDEIGYKKIDKSRNQVALMEYFPQTNSYERLATVHDIPELNDGKEHFARVEYRDGWLQFYIDSYSFPVLSTKVNLAAEIGAKEGYLGFAASTSNAYSNHDILGWTIKQDIAAPKEINVAKIKVETTRTLKVKTRQLDINVWDHNQIDGDMISLKVNDQWLLTKYVLKKTPLGVTYTLTGHNAQLILYAHNLGTTPPNTATIEIFDGKERHTFKLEANFETSQAINIVFEGE
jgi:Bacterial lectin